MESYDSDVNTTDEEDEGEDLDAQAVEGGEVDVPLAQIAVRGQAPHQFESLVQVNSDQDMEDMRDDEEIDYERLDNVDL